MKNKTTTYKWAYLPFVFSSAAILATQATADTSGSQQYQDAKQVSSINHEYVGGNSQIGFGISDEGDVDATFDQVISEGQNHSTGVGLWAGFELEGDDKGIQSGGGQINHAWVSRDKSGRATHVNKTFAAFDRNVSGHERATVGYGQENENLFWDGRVSKGLSGNKNTSNGVSDRAFDWGVGASVGKFLPDANVRIRAGVDHEWSGKVGAGEKDATNTTLSAGVEKFFQGTGHSVSLDAAGSKSDGGAAESDTDFSGRLGYKFDFGGASIYQPDRRYRRVRVEVPGQAVAPVYAQQQQFKKVPTYKTVPTYGNKTVRTPYKQLVKSSMALEGQTFFKLNSAKLIPSAQTRLKQIAAQIRKTGYKGSIRITGNTCGLGNARYDQILSEKRAKEVRNFLIKNGFNPDHLVARGLGKGHPKYPRTEDQDFKNRRVDIEYVTEQQTQKTAYRSENKKVQTGTRRVATGFKNVPAGMKNVMVSNGSPGTPRVVWKTEAIPTSPAWIKRAMHNNIKHNTNINTYTTTYGNDVIVKPVAQNDFATTPAGTAVTLDVLGNDTSNSGSNELTITSVGNPANGTAEIVNGEIVYTPNPGFAGTDTFTYTITDSNGETATATATVTVEGDKPEAEDDFSTTSQGDAVTLDVLDNDTSNSGSNQLEITSVGNPSNGTAVIVDGQIVYTPDADFVGTDTFTYTITDSNGDTATATATVVVTGSVTGDGPKAENDSDETAQGTAVTLDVLDNDTSNSGSGELTISSVGSPLNGTATIVNGEIVYTPDAGFVGTDTFTYTITDSNGDTATATATVVVTGSVTGDGPKAENDSDETGQGTAVTLDVLDNDTSNSGSGELTISSVGNPSNGTATIVNGEIVYTPDADFVGTDTFTYTITDSNGDTATATATVVVTGDNDKPDPKNDAANTSEGEAVTLDVLDNDTSNSGSGQLTITSVSNPSNGTATIVNGEIVYVPDTGFVGTDSFTYTVTDSNGETATATATVTIEANKAPIAKLDTVSTMCSAITINVLDNDDNVDGDTLSVISVNTDNLKYGTAMQSGNQIIYQPNDLCGKGGSSNTGVDKFSYTISDGNGNTDSANVKVTVEGVTDGGDTHANSDDAMINAGETVTLNVLANDSGEGLRIIQVYSDNATTEIVNNKIVYTPHAGFTGSDMFWYNIVDENGYNDAAMIIVDVLK